VHQTTPEPTIAARSIRAAPIYEVTTLINRAPHESPDESKAADDGKHDAPDVALRATGVLASLGATIPLIAAPMAGGPSTPQLVGAAAEAGGLGFLAGGYLTTDALAERITQTRQLTARLGVNLFAPNAVPLTAESYATYADVLHEVASEYGLDVAAVLQREDDDEWTDKIDLLLTAPVPVVSFTFGIAETQIVQAF
jgi:NAD(P)H-dependent flavin oxidoreductase YrpB (nitropropane dioxygenase family)